MAKSLQSRIEAIRRALEASDPETVPIQVSIILATTREQVLALQSMPPPVLPPIPENARIELSARIEPADHYLLQHAAGPPPVASPSPAQAHPAIG